MARSFKLRIQPVQRPTRIRNKAGAKIDAKIHRARQAALDDALQYCKDNECSASAAIATGLFTNVSRLSLWRRLTGAVKHGRERDYCRILTSAEESTLVDIIKNCNRCYSPLNRKDVTKLIINILKVRKENNKRLRSRNCTKLSTNAQRVLETNSLGRRFWTRFQASHPDLSIKRKGNVSVNRALNCTREMAVKHIDELAEELQKAGIMENATRERDGVWTGKIDVTRVFNHDETPQFVQYGIDGTPSGLYFAATGEACQQLIQENRECVTIQPFVSFAGDIAMCQVIFGGKSISSNMVPDEDICEKIRHLLISVTENGVQTASSLLAAYKEFDEYLTENNVPKPVVLLSDGHSSRFDFEVLSFLREKLIWLFLSPPDTTGLLQLLDQINQMLHRCYKECKDNMFSPMNSIKREGFMQILSELWGQWASKEAIVNAGKKVGVTPEKLSVDFMQTDKFEKAARVLNATDAGDESVSFSPIKEQNVRRGSKEYWRIKAQNLETELNSSRGEGIDLKSVPGLLPSSHKVRPAKVATEKIRVTQVCGSMTGKNVIELVKEIKEKKVESERQKQVKLSRKQDDKDLFLRCKDECVCNTEPCLASKLRQCSICLNIQKSQCNKKSCKQDGVAPTMISVAARKGKVPRRKRWCEETESEDEENVDSDESECESECEEIVREEGTPGPSGESSMRMRSDSCDDSEEERDSWLKVDDCVKVIKGRFTGFYGVIIPSSNDYAEEDKHDYDQQMPLPVIDIQYFKKQVGHYVVNEGDFDTRYASDVKKVTWRMDRREHYFFEGQ